MATIGSLVVDLSANSAAFTRDLGKAQRSLNSFSTRSNRALARVTRGFNRMELSLKNTARSMFSLRAVIGTVAGSAGLGLLVKRAVEMGDNIAKTADKIGVATGALQELRFAAELAGVQQNTFDMALQRFTRRAAEAANGTGEAKDALAQMGIQLRDANGAIRPTEELLGDVAEAFRGIESPAERLRLAFKLFDSEGVAMVNMLRDGEAALEATRQKARDLGLVLEDDLLRNSERTNDSISTLSQVLQARFTRAILESASAIDDIVRAITGAMPHVASFFSELIQRARTTVREFNAVRNAINSVIGFFSDPTSVQPIADLEGRVRTLNEQILETQNRLQSGAGSTGDKALLDSMIDARKELLSLISERTDQTEPTRVTVTRGQAPPAPPPILPPPGGGGGSRTRSGPTEAERAAQRIQDIVDALKFQQEQLGRTAREQEIYNQLQRAGIAIDSERGQEIATLAGTIFDLERNQEALNDVTARAEQVFQSTRTPLERYQQTVADLNELMEAGAINAATYARAIEQAQDNLQQATTQTHDFGQAVSTAFEEAVLQGRKFDDVLKGLLDTIAQILIRVNITKPLESAIGGGGGGGGMFGGLFGKVANSLFGTTFGVSSALDSSFAANPSLFGFADGGRPPVGRPSIVGERGPELFVPGGPGTIVPNHALGGGEAQRVVVRLELSSDLDARIAQTSQRVSVETVRQAAPGIQRGAVARAKDDWSRGPWNR